MVIKCKFNITILICMVKGVLGTPNLPLIDLAKRTDETIWSLLQIQYYYIDMNGQGCFSEPTKREGMP